MTANASPPEPIESTVQADTLPGDAERWVHVSRWGAAAIGAWSVGLQLLIGEVVPPVLAIGLLFAAFVPFLRPGARRLALVVGVIAVLTIIGNLGPLVDELRHPDSGWAFVPSLFVTLVAVGLAVAGSAAFRRSPASPRPLLVGASAVFAVGLLGAVVATTSVESDVAAADDTVVVASRNEFADDRIVVPSGVNGFWLDNRDGIRHTFSIRDTGFEIDAPGESQQRGDVDLRPGVYEVYCAVPGHENMAIELVVEG